ncbi:hypothetical protein CJJ23_03995 [Mycoplasmopsis agassizii]|uniref:DhaL domain-containing protein n=2 Tax=Mycoplasmopsis agassizii TaxID=33922 RepID=A0A269TI40_9BACT|nr:hypothetical protein CJJ23_03995 [Mycoplasmopsis agassizii]
MQHLLWKELRMKNKNVLNAFEFSRLFISGSNNLQNYKDEINHLNVFPVPDGDTGSNMSATTFEAADVIKNNQYTTMDELSSKISRQMLLSARGNSGVILSQIFKGFSLAFENKKEASLVDFINAINEAQKKAYESVLKPVEGTILTVIRETSERLLSNKNSYKNYGELLDDLVKVAEISLNNTPNHLKVLRDVGVVDSGGRGLLEIFKGMKAAVNDQDVQIKQNDEKHGGVLSIHEDVFEGEFGYCTEFILKLDKVENFKKEKWIEKFNKYADSLVVIQDDNILKVHGHTLRPGKLLDLVQGLGEFEKVKVDNMTLQAQNSRKNVESTQELLLAQEATKSAIISCNLGSGFVNEMKELGASQVIVSEQTQNPSAKEIIDAIRKTKAENVFILPNNGNVILAAEQAAQIIDDKVVQVIPTRNQVEGFIAIQHFSNENNLEDNLELIEEGLDDLNVVEVAQATKTTKFKGVKVDEGDYLCIVNGQVINTKSDKIKAAIYSLNEVITDKTEIAYIFYGDSVSLSDAQEIENYLNNNYDIVVEIKSGNQSIYQFSIGVK